MKKDPKAGSMSFFVKKEKIFVASKPFFTNSPEFILGGPRMVSKAYLAVKTNKPWKKSQFLIKDMEGGEKILDPVKFNTSKLLNYESRFIGTSCKKNMFDKSLVLPKGKPLQARMKLYNNLFDKCELPEDDARITLDEDEVIGEVAKGSIQLSLKYKTIISSYVTWKATILPPEDSELKLAYLDIYSYDPKDPVHVLNSDKGLIYSEEIVNLPKKGGEPLIVSNEGKTDITRIVGNRVKAFLSILNKDGNESVYVADILVTQGEK